MNNRHPHHGMPIELASPWAGMPTIKAPTGTPVDAQLLKIAEMFSTEEAAKIQQSAESLREFLEAMLEDPDSQRECLELLSAIWAEVGETPEGFKPIHGQS